MFSACNAWALQKTQVNIVLDLQPPTIQVFLAMKYYLQEIMDVNEIVLNHL